MVLKQLIIIQACEQLNAWLGGFESILKRMTPSNFNWFLHAMLFYHTKLVIKKQREKNSGNEEDEDEEDEEDTGDNINQFVFYVSLWMKIFCYLLQLYSNSYTLKYSIFLKCH